MHRSDPCCCIGVNQFMIRCGTSPFNLILIIQKAYINIIDGTFNHLWALLVQVIATFTVPASGSTEKEDCKSKRKGRILAREELFPRSKLGVYRWLALVGREKITEERKRARGLRICSSRPV